MKQNGWEPIRTADLGQGWAAYFYGNGSMTVSNLIFGEDIKLPKESVDRLHRIVQDLKEERK